VQFFSEISVLFGIIIRGGQQMRTILFSSEKFNY